MKVILNENRELAEQVKQAVKDNDGYCPCEFIKSDDTKCMCKSFREQKIEGYCHCKLYKKVK